MNPKTLGIIQLIGAILAVILGWGNWGVVVLALLFLMTAVHHLTEKGKH